jgi:hypothetical protein
MAIDNNSAPVQATAPAPDVSALAQPGPAAAPPAAAPTTAPAAAPDSAAIAAQMAPYEQKAQAATQKAADIANTSTAPPPPGPHARLLAMVQGLALGADAFGKSIATHGREGGVQEVQQVQAEQQQQKIQAQQAREAQKNTQIQQQLMVADTNHKLAQNILLLATLPEEIDAKHVELQGKKQEVAITGADFQAQHGGMTPEQFTQALSGTAPAAGAPANSPTSFFTTNANQQLSAASKILGENDPYVQKLQQTLANPASTPKDLWTASSQVQGALAMQDKVAKATEAKEQAAANSTVGKLSTPEALAAPGAQAAIQAKIDDPTTDPKDVARLRPLLAQAAVAQANAANIKEREARNQQIVNQGDPDNAGKLLANRSLTLAELKSRQVTPKFITDAIAAAQKYDPTFKAAESEAQAKIAASAANQQFFGNTDSLLVKGGTLDQLEEAGRALGNTQIPVINKLENLRKAAAGSGPLAAYYAAQLGVADDGSKVMTGGVGSDASRQSFLDIINADMSPEGRAASVAQVRKQIESQRNGRVGTNPYMKDMYPDPTTRQEVAGQAGTQPVSKNQASPAQQAAAPKGTTGIAPDAAGNLFYHDITGKVLGPAPKE